MARVPDVIEDMENEFNIHAGSRDVRHVARHCPGAAAGGREPIFPMTVGEMEDFADRGVELEQELEALVAKLQRTNRRCPEQQNFCNRSEVRKEVLKEFRTRLTAHMNLSHEMSARTDGWPGKGVDYDSLAGWCDYVNEHFPGRFS